MILRSLPKEVLLRKPKRLDVVPEPILPELDEDTFLLATDKLYPELAAEAKSSEDVVAEVYEFANTDTEGFLADLVTKGRTPDTDIMLQGFGFTPEQIDEVFPEEPPTEPLPPIELPKAKSAFTRTIEAVYGEELVQEVSESLDKPYAMVRNEDIESYIVAHPEIWGRVETYAREHPPATLLEEVTVLGRSLLRLPTRLGVAILQASQGFGGASVVDKDWADKFIETANIDFEKFVKDVSKEFEGRPTILGITLGDLAAVSQNLAFSLASMGAGLGVGIPIALVPLPGARVAAWTAGTAASGAVAYQMTTYQITQLYLEIKDEESIVEKGRGITKGEEDKLKEEFASLARRYGLWEAIPEAISNLAFVGILTAPLTGMLGRNIATRITSKIALMYGQELLTETITQKGQSEVEIEAGLREGKITLLEAFQEIAPQTFLLTTIMAGAGQVIISSSKALRKTKESLTEEIGADHPLHDEFIQNIEEEYAEEVAAEEVVEPVPEAVPEVEVQLLERAKVDVVSATETEVIRWITPEGRLVGIREQLEGHDLTAQRIIDTQGTDATIDRFQRESGFLRARFEVSGDLNLEIFGTPTEAQLNTIKEISQVNNPNQIHIDFNSADGELINSLTLTKADDSIKDVVQAIRDDALPSRELAPPPAVEEVEELLALPPAELAKRMTEKPLQPKEDVEAEALRQQELIPGQPKLTVEQADALTGFFADYINDPNAVNAWELTRELRRETRAGRAEALKARAQELIVEENLGFEEAMNRAMGETLSGELPSITTTYLEGITDDLTDALYGKVYHVLKDEPYEMASTVTALTNALMGKPIPREPGVRGGSAFTRLQRVFGDQPKVLAAIDKMATEKRPLKDVVEGIFHQTGRDPIPIDQVTAEYLRTVGKAIKDANDLALISDFLKVHPRIAEPAKKFDKPIADAFEQPPLFNFLEQSMLNRVLKELLWSPIDIGNFLRANKASFDQSFLRQSKMLAAGHPILGWRAHTTAWQSTFSQKHTEAEWALITRDPDFEIYEQIRLDTGHDPLRVPAFAGEKGTEQWRTAEEFGFPTVERLIPRLTMKLPHIKYSERGFSAGTNKIVWGVWKQQLKFARRYSEKIASGQVKLKEGESFDIIQEMADHQAMLGDLIQRANLRRFSGLAPAMNAFFFAARSKIGRFLLPKDLIGFTIRDGKPGFNPRVMKEAWKDFLLMTVYISGIMLLGDWLELWETETDPRNAEVMSARIGNVRIDPWAGQRQFVVLYARLITKTGVSSVTGAEYDVNPVGAVQSFVRNSLAPLASTLLEFWTGRNFLGQVIDYADAKYWIEKITPFSINDVWEAYEGENARMAALMVIPAIYGEGVQTYTGEWEENFAKLGLPKYTENLIWGVSEPIYDTGDFWADTARQFAGVDPSTLTEQKGFPEYIRAIAEARQVKENLAILPNSKLVDINEDPNKNNGITYVEYYQMWRDRERLVASEDEDALKAFDSDERTRNAQLGNFSQRQFALLSEYWSITDKEKQTEFLELHKDEIGTNIRRQYMIDSPGFNAQLAIWQQEKVLTMEAYKQTLALAIKFDIPDNAFMDFLPSEEVVEVYFKISDTRQSDVLKKGMTKEIAEMYLEYSELYDSGEKGAHGRGEDYRRENPELQQWGEINLGWKPLAGKKPTAPTGIRAFEGLLR